jgi:hypothetical protein
MINRELVMMLNVGFVVMIKLSNKVWALSVMIVLIAGLPCPYFHRTLHSFLQISRMSMKLEMVSLRICSFVNRYDDPRRVVVLCSCIGSLKLLKGGLVGLGRDLVICDDTIAPGEVIQNFLNSDKCLWWWLL